MSLILDALKKSEQQRQREKVPGLQSIHQPAAIPAKKNRLPWWLAAVVIVSNFAFFGYWFWRQPTTVAPVAQTAAVVTPAAPVPAQSAALAKAPQPQGSGPQETQAEFTRISPHEAPVPSTPVDVAQRVEEIGELPDTVRNELPAMTFSFHVYSDSPEQRAVIINDRRLREGDEVSAVLKLQSITQDGVVLVFQQHRIHISVLSGW